jgi:apolipoprotein N-acyltransferase
MKILIHRSLWLPVIAAFGSIVALPPISFTVVGLGTLIPLYIFVFSGCSLRRTVLGLVIYGTIFAGYTTVVTISGFTWLESAVAFHWFMYVVGGVVILLAVSMSALWGAVLWFLQHARLLQMGWARISLFCTFILVDLLLSQLLFGFNYGSFVYVAVDVVAQLPNGIQVLSTPVYLLLAVLVNAILAESVRTFPWQREQVTAASLGLCTGCLLAFVTLVSPQMSPSADVTHTRIAIIQDPTADRTVAFGAVKNRAFTFPRLEKKLLSLRSEAVDLIIYPFNPWSGVLGNSSDDNLIFDRQVVAVTTRQFSEWLQQHVAPETIFVTWYTRYVDGRFYNEVGYWQRGELVAAYQKEQLFPFFDYTPQWSQNISLYSTPIDASVPENNPSVVINQTVFAHAICSEITDGDHVAEQLSTADLLLSIGSEAMFSHEIPSVFNSVQARLYALQQQKPVIRATRTGPSVVYDSDGDILGQLRYGETSVLIVDVP